MIIIFIYLHSYVYINTASFLHCSLCWSLASMLHKHNVINRGGGRKYFLHNSENKKK
jgi:hypothetical protein